MKNNSPWIAELNSKRETKKIFKDTVTDVTIIGAGIAGISSVFFILESTDKKVLLLEKDKLAHGATGHNAGHVRSYFERPLTDIAEEYGNELAVQGQKDMESAWELLDHIYDKAGLDIPFNKIMGHAGYATLDQVIEKLAISKLLLIHGVTRKNKFYVSREVSWLKDIPKEFDGLYELASKTEILEMLESKDDSFDACETYRVACINSARFCQEVLEYLLRTYKDRFSFFEYSPVEKIILKDEYVLLDVMTKTVKTTDVLLCTNGFEHIEIFNHGGLDIDHKFHHHVYGTIGYMSAYVQKVDKQAFAGEYFTEEKRNALDPYFYVTRRAYDFGEQTTANLFSVGGPEIKLQDKREYVREYEYPEEAQAKLDEFVAKTYGVNLTEDFEHKFSWHGLMGYTKNMVRLIGREPKNKKLLYNLGCNGVGIMSSIFGSWKISRLISGEEFPPSIFDPK